MGHCAMAGMKSPARLNDVSRLDPWKLHSTTHRAGSCAPRKGRSVLITHVAVVVDIVRKKNIMNEQERNRWRKKKSGSQMSRWKKGKIMAMK